MPIDGGEYACHLVAEGHGNGLLQIAAPDHGRIPMAARQICERSRDLLEIDGNDLQAVHRALESFAMPVVHLVGGRGKGLDYRELLRHTHVRVTVCYGEAGPEIARALEGRPTRTVRDFREAIRECWGLARDGDVLLLSPACTSWDQHADYAERGRVFVDEIQRLDGGMG